jgi:uncharacterized membrane protein
VALGVRDRGGWLRLWGTLATLAAAFVMISEGAYTVCHPGDVPFLHADSVRDLTCIVLLFSVAHLLARGRRWLTESENWAPELWTFAANFLLLCWTARESAHLADAFYEMGGRWQRLPTVGVSPPARGWELKLSLWTAVWMLQAFVLAQLGVRAERGGVLRACALGAGTLALLVLLISRGFTDGWGADQLPVLHAPGLLMLAGIGLAIAIAATLAGARDRLATWERRAPEAWALAASIAMLVWSSREASHVARAVLASEAAAVRRDSLRTLTATITSGFWVLEAVALLTVGWARGSAFLRWSGLALLGLTVLKFLVVDLQTVDVFWRFLTAIATGIAMLAVSYLYQARSRSRAREG